MSPSEACAGHWRAMCAADLSGVISIADRVHPGYHEDRQVFAERRRLYPDGCLVLQRHGRLAGYAISHPWLAGRPPALNTLLAALPVPPTTYYLHDVALLPEARGAGAASALMKLLEARAGKAKLDQLSLVAVNGSIGFWQRQGFEAQHDAALQEKLKSYGETACLMVRCRP